MENTQHLMEVLTFDGIGYQPLIHCRDFRVAMLNYHPELEIENISNFQQHSLTDEAFILLSGSCTLFLAEDVSLEKVHAVALEPGKIFNVKQGSYHTHTLSKDASVLIVEADDTCDDNSPQVFLADFADKGADVRKRMLAAYNEAQTK